MMLSKLSSFGVLGLMVLGVSALPAKADTAVVQQTTQEAVIDGSGNGVAQSSQQVNSVRTRVESRSDDATGIIQDSYQGVSVRGYDNAAYQESTQINVIERRGRGRSRIEMDR